MKSLNCVQVSAIVSWIDLTKKKHHCVILLVNDNGDAKITKFAILPATGRQGTTFSIDFTFVSLNGTGTGELVVEIHTPDRIPLGAGFLLEAQKPGTYNERISVKAEPDPQCDPTQRMQILANSLHFDCFCFVFRTMRTMGTRCIQCNCSNL